MGVGPVRRDVLVGDLGSCVRRAPAEFPRLVVRGRGFREVELVGRGDRHHRCRGCGVVVRDGSSR